MVRYQKIKQILSISLINLLFLAGCSTPKQPGVALYMPERSYKKTITDTIQIESLDMINSVPMIIDTVIINSDFYSVEKDDYIIKFDKKAEIAAIESLIDTLIVDKNTTQSISDKAITKTKEQKDDISEEEKTVALITDTVIMTAKIDSTIIIYTKPDTTTIPAEKTRKADDKLTEITDTVFKTIEVEKQDTIYKNIEIERATPIGINRPVNTNIYSQNPTGQDIEKLMQSAVGNQVSEEAVYNNRQTKYENVYPNNPARSSQWQQPIVAQPGRVQIQSGEHYLTTATESQKNYLQRPSTPPQAQASALPNNSEIARLQVKLNELTNQNNRLRSTLYGIQGTIDGHRISSEQTSQASNEQKIAEISSRLDAITNLLTANATNQAKMQDTTIQKRLPQDTVINARLVENLSLTAEIENLQDSIVQLQSYIYLKDKAFDSLKGKLIAPKSNDSILFTAYYNPGKIVSTKERAILNELNQRIVDGRVVKVSLISHTDSSGSPELNFRLSNQRVVRWADELVKNNIPRKLIFMQYFGAEYASKEVVEQERRVEIIVEVEK